MGHPMQQPSSLKGGASFYTGSSGLLKKNQKQTPRAINVTLTCDDLSTSLTALYGEPYAYNVSYQNTTIDSPTVTNIPEPTLTGRTGSCFVSHFSESQLAMMNHYELLGRYQ